MAKTHIEIKPIGYIQTCFQQKFAIPRQSLMVNGCLGEIFFNSNFNPEFLFDGLKGFSHIWLIWVFDKTEPFLKSKIIPPKVKEKKGIFATRSPHRPNPVGLSCLKLLEIREKSLVVDGVDILNNSPIIDIKPYLSAYESIPATNPSWFSREIKSLNILWQEDALLQIKSMPKTYFNIEVDLIKAIEELIRLDPRPTSYIEKNHKDVYSLCIYNINVDFSIEENTAKILRIGSYPFSK